MISVFWSYKICSEVIRGKSGREEKQAVVMRMMKLFWWWWWW